MSVALCFLLTLPKMKIALSLFKEDSWSSQVFLQCLVKLLFSFFSVFLSNAASVAAEFTAAYLTCPGFAKRFNRRVVCEKPTITFC